MTAATLGQAVRSDLRAVPSSMLSYFTIALVGAVVLTAAEVLTKPSPLAPALGREPSRPSVEELWQPATLKEELPAVATAPAGVFQTVHAPLPFYGEYFALAQNTNLATGFPRTEDLLVGSDPYTVRYTFGYGPKLAFVSGAEMSGMRQWEVGLNYLSHGRVDPVYGTDLVSFNNSWTFGPESSANVLEPYLADSLLFQPGGVMTRSGYHWHGTSAAIRSNASYTFSCGKVILTSITGVACY